MKNTVKKNQFISILIMMVILFTSCDDYFTNPFKDKETGEDINLVIVDFNFFKTHMNFKITDSKTGEIIKDEAKITFTGKNANDIVTYTGDKNQIYTTLQGQLELTADPNYAITANSPFEFTTTVEIKGYNTLSQAISFPSEGQKTIELALSKVADQEITELTGEIDPESDTIFHFIAPSAELKSVTAGRVRYKINNTITISSLLKFKDESNQLLFKSQNEVLQAYQKDPQNFLKITLSKYTGYRPGIEIVTIDGIARKMLFQKLETGKLLSMVIAGKKVGSLNGGVIISNCTNPNDFIPQILTYVNFESNSWKMKGTQIKYNTLNYSYTLATVSTEELCEKGSSIAFKSNVISSFAFDADVYDKDNNLLTFVSFKGNFPETFVVENVPAKAVKLVFRNNNPSFKPVQPLQISNFCSGNYEVNVEPAAGYEQFQIVLKALCRENNQVAIAPTFSAEVKIKNSRDPFQKVFMKGGVADVLGKPNEDYELRLLWNSEWEYSSYSTKFDANGNYMGKPEADTKIVSKKLTDGRIRVNIEKIFNQNICEDLGW
jgi:hypothetical protein